MNKPDSDIQLGHDIGAMPRTATRYDVASWLVAAGALFLTLYLHLLPALLAGLLVFQLVHLLAPKLRAMRVQESQRKVVVVFLLSSVIVLGLSAAIFGIIVFLRSDVGSLSGLLQQMADIVDRSRDTLPRWLMKWLPGTAEELKTRTADLLRSHAGDLQAAGAKFGVGLVQVLIGLIIGAMISLSEARDSGDDEPFAQALTERVRRLGQAFRRVVFAQLRISALNTMLTAIYLSVVLPLIGVHLPFIKTMILVTFLAGLLPVIGNLISNTVIVIVSMSYSLGAALGSLAFLIVIHKLEYFFNARIVGTQIRARAWEILITMLAMEAAFGIAGVVAAPIFYAYLKDELKSRRLI